MRRYAAPIVWSNLAYAAASLPFFSLAAWTPAGILACFVGVSLLGLTVGSWTFHALSEPGHNHRLGHVLDHVAMHACFASLASYVCVAAVGLGWSGMALWAGLVLLAAGTLYDPASGDRITLRRSYSGIAAHGGVLLVGLLASGPLHAAVVIAAFAGSFLFRHRCPGEPSGFGWRHSLWHLTTAKAFALCAAVSL